MTDSGSGEVGCARDYAAELGVALLWCRLWRGLSLRALARRLGMSGHGGLGEYEKGRRIPPADLLQRWERVLDVPPGALAALRGRALAQRASREIRERRARQGDGTAWPAGGMPALPPRPVQLPRDAAHFSGQEAELG